MSKQWGCTGILAVIIALTAVMRDANAQAYGPNGPGQLMPPGYGGAGPGPGAFMPVAMGGGPVPYDPATMPGGYAPGAYAGGPADYGPAGPPMGMGYGDMPYGDMSGYGPGGSPDMCPYCGGSGCEHCMGADGLAAKALNWLLPYGEGGRCNPRWYDIYADVLYLRRDNVSRFVPFTSLGPAGLGVPDVVLSSEDLNFGDEAGFRFTGAFQLHTSHIVEFTYFGRMTWHSSAQVASPNNDLFSVYSNFGTSPPPSPGPPPTAGGFDETDAAFLSAIDYSSVFDSFELNLRKRWTGANCRLQGSYLMGARYFILNEDFEYATLTLNGRSDTNVNAYNSMTGFQIGGDLWANLVPGISLGADLRVGLMGDRAMQRTSIFSSTTVAQQGSTYQEQFKHTEVALLAEANLMGIYRVNPHWTLRGGLQFLYLDGVALGIENFNPTPPNTFGANANRQRVAGININGDVFYYGVFAGAEYMW